MMNFARAVTRVKCPILHLAIKKKIAKMWLSLQKKKPQKKGKPERFDYATKP